MFAALDLCFAAANDGRWVMGGFNSLSAGWKVVEASTGIDVAGKIHRVH